MPLFSCPECGNQVSTKAEFCPKCGYPLDSFTPTPTAEPAPAPRTLLALKGLWVGECGHVYDLMGHLQVVRDRVKGHLVWTRVTAPPDSSIAKRVGQSGTEFVEGHLADNQLVLNGYKADKPRLVGLSDYAIVFSEDGTSFEGTTRGRDGVPGKIRGTVTRETKGQ